MGQIEKHKLCLWLLTLTITLFSSQVITVPTTTTDDQEPGGGVGGEATEQLSMKCVCDGNCERVEESECPWGITLDVCGCCFICARGENEPCGGPLGTCAYGLNCHLANLIEEEGVNESERTGSCIRAKETCLEERELLVEKFGCFVHSGKCFCKSWSFCPDDEERFHFKTKHACESRIAFLLSQNHMKNPTSSSSVSKTKFYKGGDCTGVDCKQQLPIVQCPADSHRNPFLVYKNSRISHSRSYSHNSNNNGCCASSLEESCQCNPSSACLIPTCTTGSTLTLVRNATNQPGMCCPIYECRRNWTKDRSNSFISDEEGDDDGD